MKRVYLDNAATTPIAKEVVEVMLPLLENEFGNPLRSLKLIDKHIPTIRTKYQCYILKDY